MKARTEYEIAVERWDRACERLSKVFGVTPEQFGQLVNQFNAQDRQTHGDERLKEFIEFAVNEREKA